MTQEELIARMEDLVAAWNAGDVDRIVSAFCPPGRQTVRLEVEALLARYPDVELQIVRTLAAGTVMTTEWVARGGSAENPGERSGVTVADYDSSGRIARHTRYLRAPSLA